MSIWAMWVRRSFKNAKIVFNVGDMYIVHETQKKFFEQEFKKNRMNNAAVFMPFFELFKKFDFTEKGHFTKVIIRSGGIGDIIALSSMCSQLNGKILFISQQKYKDVLMFFNRSNIDFISYTEPILKGITQSTLSDIKRTHRILFFERTIEDGSSKNWYEIFNESIKKPFDKVFGNPKLIHSPDYEPRNYILVCHRSTASMRSMSFENVYKAILEKEYLIKKYDSICVHDNNLTQKDIDFIKTLPENAVNIVHSNSTYDFLLSVEAAGLVVSVDSAPIHFREGLKLPAIGIYNSFTAECRTKYYIHTYSFDIKSNCDKQPCFLHQFQNGVLYNNCDEDEQNTDIAPCFTEKFTPDLHKQLIDNFEIALNELNL